MIGVKGVIHLFQRIPDGLENPFTQSRYTVRLKNPLLLIPFQYVPRSVPVCCDGDATLMKGSADLLHRRNLSSLQNAWVHQTNHQKSTLSRTMPSPLSLQIPHSSDTNNPPIKFPTYYSTNFLTTSTFLLILPYHHLNPTQTTTIPSINAPFSQLPLLYPPLASFGL